jgi:hypothetical protein
MARRVDGSLGALLQGVSQQPVRQRLEGQVTEQINMTSDPVRMLHRRPPTQFLNQFNIGAVDISKTFTYYMELSDLSKYYVIIVPNATTVYIINAETGAIKAGTDTISAAFLTYISIADPRSDLRMITIGDTTFVVNTNIVPAMDATLSYPFVLATAYLLDSARVSIDVGQYSRDYTVSVVITGTTYSVTHTTPVSTAGGAEAAIATDKIAEELETLLIAEATILANFNIKRKGDSIILYPKTADLAYSVSSHDGTGGGAMKTSSSNAVSSFINLPTRAAHGSVYTITGASGEADDIYMLFQAEDTTTTVTDDDLFFQAGKWIETLQPNLKYLIDTTTMPHLMTFTGLDLDAGTATELSLPWANKIVGDTESDKVPEFIGKPINDIFTFQDRLVLLAGEYVMLSVTSDFFNFWKKTVNTLLDDGPIGLSAVSSTVNELVYGTKHNNDIIVFSNERQFKIPGSPAITPRTATMTETTAFKIQTQTPPAQGGQNIYFAVDSGTYSGIREFYTDSDLDTNNATAITVAVERYIPGTIRRLASSTNLNKLATLAGPSNILYLYEHLWDRSEKVQEAWSEWRFGDDVSIVDVAFRADNLDILVYIGEDLHFLTLSINTDTELVLGEDVFLDRRVEVIASTTGTVTSLPTDITLLDAIQSTGCPNPGLRVEILSYDGTTIRFKRDMLGGTVYVGTKYTSSVKPTMPRIRDDNGLVIGTSEFTIGEMFINFDSSGPFDVDVIGEYSYTERNSGRVLGEVSATVGEYDLTTGSFPVPVRHAANKAEINIRTDSPYPLTVVDIEWEGQFYKRGRRVIRPRG